MRTVWKYDLPEPGGYACSTLQMPKGAIVRHVASQRGALCLWAECDPEAATEARVFELFGTGIPQPTDMGTHRLYLGTVHSMGGFLVWHVYENVSP